MNKIILVFLVFIFFGCQMEDNGKIQIKKETSKSQVEPNYRLGENYCEPEIKAGCTVEHHRRYFNIELPPPCEGICTPMWVNYKVNKCETGDHIIQSIDIYDITVEFCQELDFCLGTISAIDRTILYNDLRAQFSILIEAVEVDEAIQPGNVCPEYAIQVTSYQSACLFYVPGEGGGVSSCGLKCCSRQTPYCLDAEGKLKHGLSIFLTSGDCGLQGGDGTTYGCTNDCALGLIEEPDDKE